MARLVERITLDLPKEMAHAVRAAAKARGIPMAKFLKVLIADHLIIEALPEEIPKEEIEPWDGR